ncbi:MAG TPA: metallophosphoesterase [Fibrobacteria bacterium]|nr:metallophosphoesterase [Fibrobacteria bacterium]
MPISRIIVFLVVVQGLLLLVHWYVGVRIAAAIGASGMGQTALWAVVALLYLCVPAAFLLARSTRFGMMGDVLTWIGYAWMGVLFLLLAGVLLGDASGLLVRASGWLVGRDLSATVRGVHIAGIVAALAAAGFGIREALLPPEIHSIEVDIPGLPEAFDGYRIAQVTDTHIGRILGRSWAADLARRVDSAAPDLVVHTGDLVDGTVEGMGPAVEPLSGMHGRDGTYFVTGNHEAYSGIAPWVRFVQNMGWTVLSNRHVLIHRGGSTLCLAGVTDAHEGGSPGGSAPDPRAALAGVPAGVPVVLLAHQPRQALQAQHMGVSLQLSGHTHGGQLWPFHYLVRLQQPMVSGFALVGDVPVFTSRGAGFWGPPMRLFAPPEVPILVLRRPA